MKPISLSGECSIYEISALHQKVMKSWKNDSALTLDLSKVSDIDPSFIQFLMSCKQSADAHQQSFEMLNAPQDLTGKIESMYATEFFSRENDPELTETAEQDEEV